MSFPPNLGVTNSFIIDSSCSIFQEFPSLLPHLDQICSPFSKPRMNGYSRIKKSSNRSKSIDFADLSLSTRTSPYLSKFKPTPDLRKITMPRDSIPEHDHDHEHEHEHEHEHDRGVGEVFGAILGRESCVSSDGKKEKIGTTSSFLSQNDDVVKRSFSVKRSASVTDRYSRIHHQSAEGGDECGNVFISHEKSGKKKGKFFRAFRRLFGL